jgi:gas vesicle protein
MKAFGYVAAIVGGAVAGATAALLLAPEKGEETRAKIQDSVKDFCDKHDIQNIKETVKNFCNKYKIDLTNKQTEELAEEISEA